jgi:hypothetical protein
MTGVSSLVYVTSTLVESRPTQNCCIIKKRIQKCIFHYPGMGHWRSGNLLEGTVNGRCTMGKKIQTFQSPDLHRYFLYSRTTYKHKHLETSLALVPASTTEKAKAFMC